jgi:hypothetical protein
MSRVQKKALNFRDIITIPHYKNLILKFRGEGNPRLRIGTGYLNRREEDQDNGSEESFGLRVAFPSANKLWK